MFWSCRERFKNLSAFIQSRISKLSIYLHVEATGKTDESEQQLGGFLIISELLWTWLTLIITDA